MKKLLLITLLLISATLFSKTLVSNGNGDWDDPNTWIPFGVPSSGDTIVVSINDTVTVNCVCGTYTNMVLQVYGLLTFNGGKKLNFTSSVMIEVYTSGQISGDNSGSKINIDGNTVYRGSDTLFGPSICDFSGCVPNSTLPIELIKFDVSFSNNYVTANWTTLTETNNSHFIVAASVDREYWDNYKRVEGSGNSNIIKEYSTQFIYDYNDGYIRLTQYNFDGSYTHSNIIYIKSEFIPQDQWLNVYTTNGEKVKFDSDLKEGIYIVEYKGGFFKFLLR